MDALKNHDSRAAIDGLHAGSTVRKVVEATLRDVLPDETSDHGIAELIETVMRIGLVRPHDGKRWIQLSRSEGLDVARAIGQVVAFAIMDR